MNISNAIVFDHKNRTPEGSKVLLEIRVIVNRKPYYFNTGIKVYKSDFVAGQIVNCSEAKELNDRLSIIYRKVLAAVNEYLENDAPIDMKCIKAQVWKTVECLSGEATLLDWIHEQIPKLNIKEGTRKHYVSLQNRLDEYGKMRRWQDVTVEAIVNFDAWLHQLRGETVHGRLGEGLSDAAIYNYHKCFKALLRRADLFGKIERSPYEKLRGEFKRGDRENVEYLAEAEMKAIEDLELPEGSLIDDCRDLFVLQMWTGLSYSDALAFDIAQYKKMGQKWVSMGERIKTGVPFVSQLLPPVVKVLKKHDWKVPQIENHVYNRTLKAIGMMAGTSIPLHSHLARHSFATFMLSNGTRIEHVGKMLGQTNIHTTQRYAKVLAQDVHEDFDNVAKKLNKKGPR